MIEIHGVTVLRAERVLLWDLNAVMPDGMVTVLTGRACSGKSDFMRLLRREALPTQGEIFLDRLPLTRWPANQLALRCASLPQRSVLHFPFSVRDVVDLGRIPRYQLCPPETHRMIVEDAMDCFGLLPLAKQPYASLPAAGQKRVQLARVLAQIHDANSELPIHWLLDEPTAHLDEDGVAALQRVVSMLIERHACIVFTIRDPRLAARFAQQLLVIEDGTLVSEGAHASPFGVVAPIRAANSTGRGRA